MNLPVLGVAAGASPAPRALVETAHTLTLLLLSVVLLVIVVLAGLFILKSLQRTRERMTRGPTEPTEWSDVWQMHRLPEEEAGQGDTDADDEDQS